MKAELKFISATKEYNTFEKSVPAPYIRKSFVCDEDVNSKIKIAVCGFYELFLNGEKITKGFLAPYISNTDDYVYYDEYTVSLNRGENVIGVILGNGFQNNPGGYIWDFDKASFRSAPKMAMILEYKDLCGKAVRIVSDESFKTHPSPILFDDYRFGEIYNSNCEIPGWNRVGFDDSDWENVLATDAPKGELKLCYAEPIIKVEEIKPVDVFEQDGGFVYDFGVSEAGVCRLSVSGEKGQIIELQHCDILKDGKFYIDNIWFVRELWERDRKIVHKDTYICKGTKNETYMPTFTYHGFRYVKVTGINKEQATKDLLTFVVFHSDLKTRGDFCCSDKTVNALQEMTRRSDLSNFYYFPTDCPQREKNGWTADAALSSEQMLLNFNPENSYKQWMENVRKAQAKSGALPGIVPTTGWGFDWGNGPAWDCVLFYIPYYTYIYRGDTDMIIDCKDSFIKYLKYIDSKRDKKGLIHIGLGDWCHLDRETPKAPLEVTDTVISADIANKAAFMFKAVGLNKEREYAENLKNQFVKAFRENLIDFDTMTVCGKCQTCQAMGIYYGMFQENERERAFDVLLRYINDSDEHIDVGVLGGRVLFHTLSSFGYNDLAYKMISRPDYPSYGNWVKRGATTLWEDFFPDKVSSPNHHFWGDISSWFIKCISGINYNPDGDDLTSVRISPAFIDVLESAEGYYISNFGKIYSSWQRQGNDISLKVQIPENVKAEVVINGYKFKDGTNKKQLDSGDYCLSAFKL